MEPNYRNKQGLIFQIIGLRWNVRKDQWVMSYQRNTLRLYKMTPNTYKFQKQLRIIVVRTLHELRSQANDN